MSDRFSDYGITVDESRGGEVDTLCPECSHTRKKKTDKCLSVNIAEGTWFCHHCSWNGGLKGRPEFAKTRSASKPTVYVKPEYRPGSRGALLPQEVVEWFASRCISEDTLDKEDIGYSSGWIKFPFKRNGEVVNIKSRKLLSKEFFQEKGAEKILYGMRDPEPEDIAAEEPLIWVEGEMDRLSLVEAGFKFVVSVPDGAPTPGAKQTQTKFDFLSNCESYINKFQQHIIAVDNDAPGAFLEGELARRLGIERCKRTVWPAGCKDANDTLMKHGKAEVADCISGAQFFPVDGIYEVKDIIGDAARLYDEGVARGVSTGWSTLDPYLSIRPGELAIITGIPSSGKSSWVDHLMVNLSINDDYRCGVYSPENAPLSQHFKKLAECYIGKPFLPGQTERMTPTEVIDAGRFLNQHFFFISANDSALTINQILEKARVLVFRHGINFLVIDPFNDIDQSDLHGQNETDRISVLLSKCQRFARMHKVFVALVAHPTKLKKDEKTGEYPCPTPYDISGSSHFRNRGDVCLAAHRPDMTKDFIELHVQKIRFKEIGTPGMVRLDYSRQCGRFIEHLGYYGKTRKEREAEKRRVRNEVAAELAEAREACDSQGDGNE